MRMSTEFRILVCGGRNYDDQERVYRILDAASRAVVDRTIAIIHGDAKGADHLADVWAKERQVSVLRFPADWESHGKRAGPIRNKQMLDEGKPHVVVAFPGGSGTKHMVGLARQYGIPVKEVFK